MGQANSHNLQTLYILKIEHPFRNCP